MTIVVGTYNVGLHQQGERALFRASLIIITAAWLWAGNWRLIKLTLNKIMSASDSSIFLTSVCQVIPNHPDHHDAASDSQPTLVLGSLAVPSYWLPRAMDLVGPLLSRWFVGQEMTLAKRGRRSFQHSDWTVYLDGIDCSMNQLLASWRKFGPCLTLFDLGSILNSPSVPRMGLYIAPWYWNV